MQQPDRWPFTLAATLSVLDSAVVGILVSDADGVIRYVNPAYTQITGIPAAHRAGQNLFDSRTPGAGAQALRTRRPVSGLRYRPAGSRTEVLSSASPIIADGELVGVVVFFQDITAIVRLTESLERSERATAALADKLGGLTRARYSFADLVGEHPRWRAALDLARKAALGDSTVLITGETGTGKELFAHAVHNASPRAAGPFIVVNCAAVPPALMESEFFGHEKGAFTGADRRRAGYLELADGGTLFLDELGELEPGLQAKLLRFLQSGEFSRVGAPQPRRADVRIIAATNRRLEHLVDAGRMRGDLFYRLNVVRVELPPLRERSSDIPGLVHALLPRLARRVGKPLPAVPPAVLQALTDYSWPGNVRELENVLERALNVMEGATMAVGHLGLPRWVPAPDPGAGEPAGGPAGGFAGGVGEPGDILPLAELERRMIERALERYGRSVEGKRQAAAALGISLTTLYNRLRSLPATH